MEGTQIAPPHAARERMAFALALAGALALLAWLCRGAPLGVPVADDYLFLAHLRFGRFDWLDSFGAQWYWRPLSRQAYYAALGGWMLDAPARVALVHATLLTIVAAGTWDFARRRLPVGPALLAALFPLTAESARVLLGWPAAAQHLLALAAVALALAAAARGRMVAALIACAAALASIESAALLLPALPLVAARGRGPSRRTWIVATATLAILWLAARGAVAARGVIVPAGMAHIAPAAALRVLRLSLMAELGIEDLSPLATAAIATLYAIALAGAAWPSPRRDASRTGALATGGLVAWAAGTLPLAAVLPNWNAWRAGLPGLGLGLACAAWLARGRAWTLALFAAARLAALLLAAPAPAHPASEPPASVSDLSFPRLARLQRLAIATRAALDEPPELGRGARARYWNFPFMCEYGFAGPAAVRLWQDDPTLEFLPFEESVGLSDTTARILVFDLSQPRLVVRVRSQVQAALAAADAAARAGRLAEADAELARALAVQPEAGERLRAVVYGNRTWLLMRLGQPARADSVHRLGVDDVPASDWLRAEAALALALGDTARAERAWRAAKAAGIH